MAVRPDLFWDLRGRLAPRGEARLALAVLEDAIGCLPRDQDPRKVPTLLFQGEAEQWIESKDRVSLFSFENICAILSLDARKVRARIHRWHAAEQTTQHRLEPGKQTAARGTPTHPPTPFPRFACSTSPGPGRSRRPAPGPLSRREAAAGPRF